MYITDTNIEINRGLSPQHHPDISSLSDLINLPVRQKNIHWRWSLTPEMASPFIPDNATLHIAAATGDTEIIRLLIDHGATIDGLDVECETPLLVTTKYCFTTAVDLLLDAGASPNAVDSLFRSPCMMAASRGDLPSLQAMVRHGGDLELRDLNHQNALHYAARSGAGPIMFFLMSRMVEHALSAEDNYGESPLGHALVTIPSFILNLDLSPSVYLPRKGNVLSHTATSLDSRLFRHLLKRLPRELLRLLLSHEHQLDGSPLYAASTFPKNNDNINVLLDAGAELELEGGDHGTPLMSACACGRLEAVKILVARGAKTSYSKDGKVVSALRAAKNHPKIVRWLLVGRFLETPKLITSGTDF